MSKEFSQVSSWWFTSNFSWLMVVAYFCKLNTNMHRNSTVESTNSSVSHITRMQIWFAVLQRVNIYIYLPMILLILWYSDFTWHCLSIKIVTIGCCWKWTCFFPTEAPAQKQVYKSTEDFLQLKELSGQISTNSKWIPAKLYLAFIVIYCHLPRSIICSKNGLDFLWMVQPFTERMTPNRWADIGESHRSSTSPPRPRLQRPPKCPQRWRPKGSWSFGRWSFLEDHAT